MKFPKIDFFGYFLRKKRQKLELTLELVKGEIQVHFEAIESAKEEIQRRTNMIAILESDLKKLRNKLLDIEKIEV